MLTLSAQTRQRIASTLARTVLISMVFAVVAPANAMSIRQLQALRMVKTTGALSTYYYLIGVMEGQLAANAQLAREGKKPWFCLREREIRPTLAETLYNAEIRRNIGVYEADMPVDLVMHNALAATYSCE